MWRTLRSLRTEGNGVRLEYGLIEAPDLRSAHLAQSPGIKSSDEWIPVMAGESPQNHRPLIRCDARTRNRRGPEYERICQVDQGERDGRSRAQ
jgi:hypothetical protein